MNKLELIKYANDNGYEYLENKDEIEISNIYDDLGIIHESITYFKNDKSIQLWLEDNGSGKVHILNGVEMNILISLYKGDTDD